jgi:hypothetical protein
VPLVAQGRLGEARVLPVQAPQDTGLVLGGQYPELPLLKLPCRERHRDQGEEQQDACGRAAGRQLVELETIAREKDERIATQGRAHVLAPTASSNGSNQSPPANGDGFASKVGIASFMAWVPSRSCRSEPTPPHPISTNLATRPSQSPIVLWSALGTHLAIAFLIRITDDTGTTRYA